MINTYGSFGSPEQGSMFHDRDEPLLVDFIAQNNLPHNASDEAIASLLAQHLEETGTYGLAPTE